MGLICFLEAESRCSGTPSPLWVGASNLFSSLDQVRQCLQYLDLAPVLSQAMQPILLRAELLLDHTEGMLALGADVGLSCFDQVLTFSFWCVR